MASDKNGPPERKLSALDRMLLQALGEGRTVGLADDPARKLYPTLWDWLSKTDGGTDFILQPAILSVQLGPEGALASMTHRDLKVSCSVACPYLADFLACLEAALSSSNPPLRSWGKDPQVQLKKRKRKS